MAREYKHIDLGDGRTLQIKFDHEGIVYDIFDQDGEVVEELGYDFYNEVLPAHITGIYEED